MSDSSEPASYQPPKFCPQCGKEVTREGAKFCTNCGRNFVKSSGSEQTSQNESQTQMYPSSNEQNMSSSGASGSTSSSSTYTGSMQNQPMAYQTETWPRKTYDMTTPNDIKPVSSKLITRDEIYIVLLFAGAGFISHLMRYFLMFNNFPNVINFLLPIPLYILVVFLLLIIQKYFGRDKGIQFEIEADRFDYTRSLVFSSFFLTLIPPRFKINKEESNVPDTLYTPQSTQNGISYQQVSRSQYVGEIVKPRMAFMSNFVIFLLGFVAVLFYFNTSNSDVQRVFRLVTLYISSFVLVELAPIFGRHNELSGEYGRIRTLIVFVLNLLVFFTALLGEQFFTALQNL